MANRLFEVVYPADGRQEETEKAGESQATEPLLFSSTSSPAFDDDESAFLRRQPGADQPIAVEGETGPGLQAQAHEAQSLASSIDILQPFVGDVEYDMEYDDYIYDVEGELDRQTVLGMWNRTNKMTLGYTCPMVLALIILLSQHLSSEEEAACQMKLRFWSVGELVLLSISFLLAVVLEWQIGSRLNRLRHHQQQQQESDHDVEAQDNDNDNDNDSNDEADNGNSTPMHDGLQEGLADSDDDDDGTNSPTHTRIWRTYFCSRLVMLAVFTWMLVGTVWALPETASSTCGHLALYSLVLSLIYTQIFISGFVVLGWLGCCLSLAIGTLLYRSWLREQELPTATPLDLESCTQLLSFDDLADDFKNDKCAICLCPFDPKAAVDSDADAGLPSEMRQLKYCTHVFHRECIDQWLLENNRQCPLCRQSIQRWAHSPSETRDDTVDLESPDPDSDSD